MAALLPYLGGGYLDRVGGDPISDSDDSQLTPLPEDWKESEEEGPFKKVLSTAPTPQLTPCKEQNDTSDNGQAGSSDPPALLALAANRKPAVASRRACSPLTGLRGRDSVTPAAHEDTPSTSSGSSSRLYNHPDSAVATEESERQTQEAPSHGNCRLARSPVRASPGAQACQDDSSAERVPGQGCEPVPQHDFLLEEDCAAFNERSNEWSRATAAQEMDGSHAAVQREFWDGEDLQGVSHEQQNTQQMSEDEHNLCQGSPLRHQGSRHNDIPRRESQDDQAQAVFNERFSEWAEAAHAQEAGWSQAAVQQGFWDEAGMQAEDQEQQSTPMSEDEHDLRQGSRFRHRGFQDSDIMGQEGQDDQAQATFSERFNEWGGAMEAEEADESQAAVHQGIWEGEEIQEEDQEQQGVQRMRKNKQGLRQGSQNELFRHQGFQDYDIRWQGSLGSRAQVVSSERFNKWTRATKAQKVDESQAAMQQGTWYEEDLEEKSQEEQGMQQTKSTRQDLRLGSLHEPFHPQGFRDNDMSWQESRDGQVFRQEYSDEKESQPESLFSSLISPLWECQRAPLTLKSCLKKHVVETNGQARAVGGPFSLPKRQALRWRSMTDVMTIECDTAPAKGLVGTSTEALQEEPAGFRKVRKSAIKMTLCDGQACALWAIPMPYAPFSSGEQFP